MIVLQSAAQINHIMKFADDTTVPALSAIMKSAYRDEMEQFTDWCRDNSLSLKVDKMLKIIVESVKPRNDHSTVH